MDERPDIIYQKDASFSATLDIHLDVSGNKSRDSQTTVSSSKNSSFQTTTSPSSNSFSINVIDESATKSYHNGQSTCANNCGSGKCLIDINDVEDATNLNPRCRCMLGKTGVDCQTGNR